MGQSASRIVQGHLTELAGPNWKFEALDAIPYYYLKLRLRLRWYGFDAAYHFYDWRQNLNELGQELDERLQGEPAGEIFLVAHSMGGLVARAAIAKGGEGVKKIKKLIMLGTPNFGSFEPVLVLRGIYSTTKLVAAIDPFHNATELTQGVFNTFPSVYQLLPSQKKFTSINLYDPSVWPTDPPQLQPGLLQAAPAVQQQLAGPDGRFVLIAGVNQDTITNLTQDADGSFTYVKTPDGDGTVPLDFAKLPGVTTYYVEALHGDLPNDGRVGDAVRDILNDVEPTTVDSSWDVPRGGRRAEVREADLRAAVPFDGRRGNALTEDERRLVLASLFGPSTVEVMPASVAAGAAVAVAGGRPPSPAGVGVPPRTVTGVPAPPGAVPADARVVVGRRRQKRLDLGLAYGSITDVPARAYVLGIFQNVAPTGPARVIDHFLRGAVSEFVERRMFAPAVGQVFMLPTGIHPLQADVVLFAGLGQFDQFNADVQKLVAENVIRTLLRAGIDEFATVLFGSGSGVEVEQTLGNLVGGFLAGLRSADQEQRFRRVVLCELDAGRYAAMRDEIYRLAGTPLFDDVEITIDEIPVEAVMPVPADLTTRLPGKGRERIYLLARKTSLPNPGTLLETALLTVGGKAGVFNGVMPIDDAKLNSLLGRVSESSFNLDTFGPELAKMILTNDFLDVLGRQDLQANRLVIVHDALASRIPWETLKVGDSFPALAGGTSRRYMDANLSIAKYLEERRFGPVLDLLFIANPTENLPGAQHEEEVIDKLASVNSAIRVDKLVGRKATRDEVQARMQSGNYDAIHYAGHAHFDAASPGRSGILLRRQPGVERHRFGEHEQAAGAGFLQRLRIGPAARNAGIAARRECRGGVADSGNVVCGSISPRRHRPFCGNVLVGRRRLGGDVCQDVLREAPEWRIDWRSAAGGPGSGAAATVCRLGGLHSLWRSGFCVEATGVRGLDEGVRIFGASTRGIRCRPSH